MTTILQISLVALGGAVGAVGRYLMSGFIGKLAGAGFPYGTLAVNILGGFLMGILIAIITKYGDGAKNIHLLLATGVLGGFTTFSAFSLEVVNMFEQGNIALAIIYIASSVLGACLALWCGLILVK